MGKKNAKSRSGYGIMLYEAGLYYIGCWMENMKHGMGFMIDRNGGMYKGEWALD